MVEKKPKKIFYYGRRPTPLKPEQLNKLKPVLGEGIDQSAVEVVLAQLDDKFYVSTTYCDRIAIYLSSTLGVPRDKAELLIALRLDQPDLKALHKSRRQESHYKERLAKMLEQQRLLEEQAKAKVLRKEERELAKVVRKQSALARTSQGNYGMMGTVFGMHYFFENKIQYLHLIEDMLETHTDEYLQLAVDVYPYGKMGWIQYHYSFEEFWRKVNRMNIMGTFDFSEPGLKSVRRLAMYLYTWNFRRYIEGEVICRHARFLPRLYRHIHVAAVLDQSTAQEVDLEYDEVAFEDEDAYPDDNIGNRI